MIQKVEEKCLRNVEMGSFSKYIYSHLLKKLELSKFKSYVEKKLWGSKNPEKIHIFFFFFVCYSCLVLKFEVPIKNYTRGHKIINLASKVYNKNISFYFMFLSQSVLKL